MRSKISEYEEPSEEGINEVRLYWRLQREAQIREDRAAFEQRERERAAMYPPVAREPRFVGGRWIS